MEEQRVLGGCKDGFVIFKKRKISLSLQSLCVEEKIKLPDLLHSCRFPLCVHENVNKRETGWRVREGPCVHWRQQPKASVCSEQR